LLPMSMVRSPGSHAEPTSYRYLMSRSLAGRTRFIHGCPPRKSEDISIGDAFNWEWMIHCANANRAELVIVSRDQDYGIEFEKTTYLNDHLKQEFSERVSQKRKILLYTRLSEALKHFEIKVTPEEEDVERDVIRLDEIVLEESSSSPERRQAPIVNLMEALRRALGDLPETNRQFDKNSGSPPLEASEDGQGFE